MQTGPQRHRVVAVQAGWGNRNSSSRARRWARGRLIPFGDGQLRRPASYALDLIFSVA